MTRTPVLTALFALALPGLLAAAPAPAKRAVDEKVRELRKEQVKALSEQLETQFERVQVGKDPLSAFLDAVRDLAEAEQELAETREAELAALEGAVKRLKEAEGRMEQLHAAGLQAKTGVAQVRAARLKAEIQLEKRKGRS